MRVPGSAHANRIRRAGAGALLVAAFTLGSAAPASADAACPGSDLQPNAANLAQVEAATLCLVNEQRAANGLGALTFNSVLQNAALEHSNEMVDHGFFSHDSVSGEDFEDRIIRFKYAPTNVYWVAGENLAWGTLTLSTPDAIVDGWMHSPEHRANVLSGEYKELGVGIAPGTPEGDSTGATYTADFGARASGPTAAKRSKSHKRSKHRRHRHTKKHKHGKKRCETGSAAVSLC